jgi:hypothetical protein
LRDTASCHVLRENPAVPRDGQTADDFFSLVIRPNSSFTHHALGRATRQLEDPSDFSERNAATIGAGFGD